MTMVKQKNTEKETQMSTKTIKEPYQYFRDIASDIVKAAEKKGGFKMSQWRKRSAITSIANFMFNIISDTLTLIEAGYHAFVLASINTMSSVDDSKFLVHLPSNDIAKNIDNKTKNKLVTAMISMSPLMEHGKLGERIYSKIVDKIGPLLEYRKRIDIIYNYVGEKYFKEMWEIFYLSPLVGRTGIADIRLQDDEIDNIIVFPADKETKN